MLTSGPRFTPPAQGLYDPHTEHDACGVGFVVHIKGQRSHDIVRKALQVLINLEHRGACGCEANTGDGAGILIQMPDAFLRKSVSFTLPADGGYGAGLVFLPHEESDRDRIKDLIARITERRRAAPAWLARRADRQQSDRRQRQSDAAGLRAGLHRRARSTTSTDEGRARFERKLYVIRKRIEHAVDALKINALSRRFFYIVSLSSQRLIYKGMLQAKQLAADVPRSHRTRICSRRSRSCTSGSAPTRSRRGRWRIPTGSSRTTARSTRCAATSTGCVPAKACSRASCSATTCRSCCRSSAKAAATRRRSTTCSSC